MTKKEQMLFTIGQFAALHGINKKTLMWYDEIGLFKPVCINEENGYRFYSYYQSTELETILLLRDMNIPLKNIQDFMQSRSAENMEGLLKEKIAELDQAIQKLKAVQSKLCNSHNAIHELLKLDLSEITFIKKEPHYLVTVPTSPEKSLEDEIELIIAQTQQYNLPRMYQASYGSMLSVQSLYEQKFENYSMLFIEVPNLQPQNGLHVQPGGTYLRAFCIGNWDKLSVRYKEIVAYAEQNHLQLCGYAYETGINEMFIDKMDDYITKIEIPVFEKGY